MEIDLAEDRVKRTQGCGFHSGIGSMARGWLRDVAGISQVNSCTGFHVRHVLPARVAATHAIMALPFLALEQRMKTIDEMLQLRLLSVEQHAEISAWVTQARTPEAILQMPRPLWRTLELASVLMNFDADLLQPPCFDNDVEYQH